MRRRRSRGESFVYGDRDVHGVTVLGPVIGARGVVDYRILQTPGGVDAEVVGSSGVDSAALAADLSRALAEAGLHEPRVTVRIVDHLERDPCTGKVRRLVPFESLAAASGERR